MSQYRKKVDKNQKEIVAGLRQVGASVKTLHWVGRGVPDLLVGFRGVNYLIEVKQPGKGFTKAEAEFFNTWRGSCAVVESLDEALEILGVI